MGKKVVGVELVSNKDEVLRASAEQIHLALTAMGMTAEGHAKEILTDTVYSQTGLPYQLTGNLRNSITHAEDDTSMIVGTNVEYAEGIETGSHRRKGAVHYLQNSLANHVDEYKNILKDALKS